MEKSAFRVWIKDINNLYEDFLINREIAGYLLGELYLNTKPVEAIVVRADKMKNNFGICVSMEASRTDENYLRFSNLKIPINRLRESKNFKLGVNDGDKSIVYVLDQDGNRDMYIKLFYGDIKVGFGYYETPYKEIVSPTNFQNILEKLNRLVEEIMVGLCKAYGFRVPKKTLLLLSQEELIKQYNQSAEAVKTDEPTKTKQAEQTTILLPQKINYPFEAIGGQAKAKEEAISIAEAIKHQETYKKWGTKPARGIMFHGPTGTGKTILAKALASAIDANFYNIKSSEIFTMWYGESGNKIQKIFDQAKKEAIKSKKKSVLFFDEIDSLVSSREGMHEESQRVVQVLLTNLDGLEAFEDLIVVAATNRKDCIDSAFLRPGRIDKLVEVPLPDALGRQEIFSVHINACEKLANAMLFDQEHFDWSEIKKRTEGMNGAEISEIVRRSLEEKVKQEIAYSSKKPEDDLPKPEIVNTSDILRHINNYEKRSDVKKIGFITNN